MFTLLQIDADTMIRGLSISIVGIAIVFVALILISLFIAALPRLLSLVAGIFPEAEHARTSYARPDDSDDSEDIAAAIGFVLHTEFQRQLIENQLIQGRGH